MDGIKIEVTGNIARIIERPARITAGTVGLPVEFSFDNQWEGLSKTAVFKAGCTEKIVENLEAETAVPWEVTANPNVWLSIGVYGVNADGSEAIPTIWANVCAICDGANPEGDVSTAPTLPVWQRLWNSIGNLLGLTTNAKGNLVEAINEVNSIALAGGIESDPTLSQSGKAADAKATGDAIKSLTAEEVGARPDTWMPTAEEVGAAPANLAKYTSYGAKNNYCTKLLDVRIDDINAPQNQMSVVATEDATTLVDSPIVNGAFYAHREVQLIDSPYGRGSKAIVKLTEMYPQAGRILVNAYNPDTSEWSGWKIHELTDYTYNFALNNNEPVKNNYITDVLSVDLNNPNSIYNRSGFFDSSANACPPNVAFGVRDVYFVNAGFVIVEARCFITDSRSQIWRNTYNQNAGGWLGWDLVYDSRSKPTASDVGAAPAGYGLGGVSQYVSRSEDAVESGFYQAPVFSEVAGGGRMFGYVSKTTDGWITQIWHYIGLTIKRDMQDGVWQPIEYFNPPMILGFEYRTVERFNGKPVYAKAVELNLAGNGFKSVHVANGITEIVSMEGNYYQNWGGVLSEKTVNPSAVQLNLSVGSLQINSTDMGSTTAKYIVKYTK